MELSNDKLLDYRVEILDECYFCVGKLFAINDKFASKPQRVVQPVQVAKEKYSDEEEDDEGNEGKEKILQMRIPSLKKKQHIFMIKTKVKKEIKKGLENDLLVVVLVFIVFWTGSVPSCCSSAKSIGHSI